MRFTRWDGEYSTEDTNETVSHLALAHCAAAACPEGEAIAALICSNNYAALCAYELGYADISPNSAYHCRQALAFYQKREDLDIGVDKEAVAYTKFVQAEQLCQETNDILRMRSRGAFSFAPRVESVLHGAQRKIAAILGECPSISELTPRFGPGATTKVTKREASPRKKLGTDFVCSEDFLPLLKYALEEMPAWLPENEEPVVTVSVEISPGVLRFVPKNAKTYRSIVVEPMLNSMFQLGLGDLMGKRLLHSGVTIFDQTPNQRAAREGSLTGALATLDLSSASDTIAKELVFDLLPLDWAMLLSRLRSGRVTYGTQEIRLQKISSMGNGFTFPLETLIFYALAYASTKEVDRHLVRAYGDDLIVPTYAYGLLCEVLNAVGFIVNPSKSFSSGSFRESCGKDYLSGIEIRPFYLKGPLSGFKCFSLHNYYVRRGEPEFAAFVLAWIDESLRIYGPDGYGDGHLLGDWTPRPHGREKQWSGYIFDTFTFKSRHSFEVSDGDRILPSYTVYASPSQEISLDSSLRSFFLRRRYKQKGVLLEVNLTAQYRVGKAGFAVTLPGTKGYKRISIYVLCPVG